MLNNKKYNLLIISIILIGFTLSNWAEFFHNHSHKESNHNSCCGHSCYNEIESKDISFKKADSEQIYSECSLCKVISVSSFNYLINQFKIDFLTKTFDFSFYQSINYTFQKILNLKNKSPPSKN